MERIRPQPDWKAEPAVTREQLTKMREEFWDTSPAYGGHKVVWESLRGVCETGETADAIDWKHMIIDSAGITVSSND